MYVERRVLRIDHHSPNEIEQWNTNKNIELNSNENK